MVDHALIDALETAAEQGHALGAGIALGIRLGKRPPARGQEDAGPAGGILGRAA